MTITLKRLRSLGKRNIILLYSFLAAFIEGCFQIYSLNGSDGSVYTPHY